MEQARGAEELTTEEGVLTEDGASIEGSNRHMYDRSILNNRRTSVNQKEIETRGGSVHRRRLFNLP